MLGFDALGRLALGQAPVTQSLILPAVVGSYVLTGRAALFQGVEQATGGSYVVTGNAATFAARESAVTGAYALSGAAAALRTSVSAAAGVYSLNGQPTAERVTMPAVAGVYVLAGSPANFAPVLKAQSGAYAFVGGDVKVATRFAAASGSYALEWPAVELRSYGYGYEPTQYGIGHIKLEIEEARRRQQVIKPPTRPVLTQLPPLPRFAAVSAAPLASGLLNGAALPVPANSNAALANQRIRQRQQAIALLLMAA